MHTTFILSTTTPASPAELRRQKMVGGGERRRSSLGDIVLGGSSVLDRRTSATVVPEEAVVSGASLEDEGLMDTSATVVHEIAEFLSGPSLVELPEDTANEEMKEEVVVEKKKTGKRYEDDFDDGE